MASGFFALLDDIAVLLDDVAVMSKLAAKKTAGILGDDLAVNAEKASGFDSSRELTVLWKITKGSLVNKIIILPFAFLLSAFLPQTIIPILLIGGVYLAYEGAHKIHEYFFHKTQIKTNIESKGLTENEILEYEKSKIKSAIIVDFILSVEIIIIALSTVVEKPLNIQIVVVSIIALLATVGVYGIVALIVRMDDLGFKLIASSKNEVSFSKSIGKGLVYTLPVIIKSLSIIGTIAMILVSGGIFVHNLPFIHDLFHALPAILSELIVGIVVGFIALFAFNFFSFIFTKKNKK